MSIINIDKRAVPVTARNGRIYTTTGNITNSSSNGTTIGSGLSSSGLSGTYIPKFNGVQLVNSGLHEINSQLGYGGLIFGVSLFDGIKAYEGQGNGYMNVGMRGDDSSTYINFDNWGSDDGISIITAKANLLTVTGDVYANKNGAVFSMGNGGGSFGTIGFNNTSNDVEIKQKYSSGGIRLYTNTTVERLAVLANGNTEFRNATGVLIAILDTNGNLKVKGEITAFATI